MLIVLQPLGLPGSSHLNSKINEKRVIVVDFIKQSQLADVFISIVLFSSGRMATTSIPTTSSEKGSSTKGPRTGVTSPADAGE